jgi:hypothetical protein
MANELSYMASRFKLYFWNPAPEYPELPVSWTGDMNLSTFMENVICAATHKFNMPKELTITETLTNQLHLYIWTTSLKS